MQASCPLHWNFATRSGIIPPQINEILVGSAYMAVVAGDDLQEDITRVRHVLQASDWGPMVRARTDEDIGESGRKAIVLEVWSESDSLTFLRVRMDVALSTLSNAIEALGLPVVIAPTRDEALERAAALVADAPAAGRRPELTNR